MKIFRISMNFEYFYDLYLKEFLFPKHFSERKHFILAQVNNYNVFYEYMIHFEYHIQYGFKMIVHHIYIFIIN